MKIRKSKVRTFLKLNFAIKNYIHNVAEVFSLTESKSPGLSLRSKSYKNKDMRYIKDNLEIVNIGLFSHNIMHNQEYILLRNNISYFRAPVLDIGCGDGQFASLLFNKIEAGVDLSDHSIAAASKLGLYNDLKVADCTKNIPYPDGHFKTIFSNSVMEHIPDIEGVVKEASRTLAKGGRFIITTYSDEFLGQLSSAIGKEMANSYNSGLTHVSLYSPEYWNDLLRKHKFTTLKVVPYLPLEALVDMVIFSSRFFIISQLISPYIFWHLSKDNLHRIVSSSLETKNGLGFLLIAQKE